jgi:DNA-binding MarR family transcriptional regulator
MSDPALTPDETHIWRSVLRLSDLLRFRVAAEMREVSDLSRTDHSVLLHLAEVDGGQMVQQQLVESMCWSKSRMSHQLARMEGRGLVERTPDPQSRQMIVTLTEKGYEVLDAVASVHATAVRRHLFEQATADELTALVQLSQRISGRGHGQG